MSFGRTYEEIRELIQTWALATPHARAIMRKSGWLATSQAALETIPGPILSLPGTRRVCFDPGPASSPGGAVVIENGNQGPNFVVNEDGKLYSWGFNTNQKMGGTFADYGPYFSPTPIHLDLTDIVQMSAQSTRWFLAVRANGAVLHGGPGFDEGYEEIEEFGTDGAMVAAATGSAVTFHQEYVLKTDGTVWARGLNLPGMGIGNAAFTVPWGTTWRTLPLDQWEAMPAGILGGSVERIGATTERLSFLRTDGAVGTWQNNQQFPVFASSAVPTNIAKFDVGGPGIVILTDDGEIWSAGSNTTGAQGTGTIGGGLDFTTFQRALLDGYTDVAAGPGATFAVKDGYLYSWGQGGLASGRGVGTNTGTPTQVTNPDIDDVVSVYAGYASYTPMYTTEHGCTYIWGRNYGGLLGQGYSDGLSISLGSSMPIPLKFAEAYPAWPIA